MVGVEWGEYDNDDEFEDDDGLSRACDSSSAARAVTEDRRDFLRTVELEGELKM